MSLELYILDLGQIRLDRNFIVAGSTYASPGIPGSGAGELTDIPIAAYLVKHQRGHVLYDTGCHPNCMGSSGRWAAEMQRDFPWTGGEECTLPSRLRALGLTPDDIPTVVLSHLHCDHAGCVEFFRKSTVYVHEDEFSGAMTHYARHNHRSSYVWKDMDAWMRSPLDWTFVGRDEAEIDLADGVRILNLGSGHSYGMLALTVRLQRHRSVLLASDACYCRANLGPPARVPGILFDSLGYRRSIDRLNRVATDRDLDIWFGHDPEQFATLTKSTEGHYD